MYAHAQSPARRGSAQLCEGSGHRGGHAVAAWPPGSHTHAEGAARELVVWAAMLPRKWIQLPRFFAEEIQPRGPVELWLQHAGCCSQATKVEVEVVPPGDIFMTRGWGEMARACYPEGAPSIHFEYDGASTLFFQVFSEYDFFFY